MRRRTARGVSYGIVAFLVASCSHTPPTRPAPELGEPPAATVPVPVVGATHRIEPGDTVWEIARYHGVSTASVIQRNRIGEVSRLRVGRVLVIPDSKRAVARASTALAPDTGEVNSAVSTERAASREATYRVQAGDTVWRIARRHGLSVDALMEANRIEDARKLRAGRLVAIPAPPPALDSVDPLLEAGEQHLQAAEVDEALKYATQALRLLVDIPDSAGARARIARAEVIAATVHVAYSRRDAAIRSFQRALRADQHLRLDPVTTSPKVLRVLAEARSELDRR